MKNQISVGSWVRKHWVFASGTLVLLACLIATTYEALRHSSPALHTQNVPIARAVALASYGKLPLVFEKNLGQTSSQVKFLAHASGYALFLTGQEAVLRLDVPDSSSKSAAAGIKHRAGRDAKDRKAAVVSLSLAGSHSPAQIEGLDVQPGHTNYFIGRNSSRWQRNIPLYARVKYRGVYPGVDAIYYGNESRLETDYIVSPGSDPNQIVLHVQGSKSLATDAQGNVVLASAAGNLILHRPNVYQQIGGARQAIAANYFKRGKDSIGIRLGAYDSRQPLVIDPVLDYSTLLGGSGGEAGNAIAVDSSGDAYVCGSTSSSLFPTTNGVIQGSLKVSTATNAFITEFDPTGTTLIFSTYLGGSTRDSCTGIGLDSSENVYVTGTTQSLDFPLGSNPSPIMSTFPLGNLGTTGFFAEITSAGTALTYSTYLGGNYRDTPAGLAVDATGIPYVVGSTESTNFPTSTAYGNAYQTTSIANDNANAGSGFLSKINPSLPGQTALLYSTYLGGSVGDSATAVAVDAAGNAYITGSAGSSDFPILNAYQPFIDGAENAFVTRIDTTQAGISSLIYSSYLGGSGNNGGEGNAIAADNNFNAYIGGVTATNNFPTTAGVITPSQAAAGYIMGFAARFNTSLSGNSSLLYSTYLGGSNVSGTLIYGIAADTFGDAYVTGSTFTNNYYITLGAPQGQLAGASNAIVTELNPTGTAALFSTYFGGSNNDQANAIVLDSSVPPNVYIAGTAQSQDFPVTSTAYQKNLDGLSDAFVVKMSPVATQGIYATPATLSFGNQGTGTSSSSQPVTLINNTSSTLSNIAITFTGSNPLDFAQSNNCGDSSSAPGSLPAFSQCTINVTFTPSNSGAESATMNIADSGAGSPQTVALTGTGTAVAVSPSSLAFGSQTENTASAAQSVTITNNGANPLTGIAVSVTGLNAADFTQTNTCGSTSTTTGTLAAGANCMVNLIFTPTTTAAESASLQITDSDPSSPQLVPLTGTGTMPVSGVAVSPTSLSFGNQSENTSSISQPVTLTNNGSGSLTTITLTFTGTNANDFSETDNCGSPGGTLAAGASCIINVTFTPSTQAAETANLSVADSNVTSPQLVPITGTGTVPVTAFTVSISPSSATINAGDTTTVVATVTSENAFNSPVSFAFAGTPGDTSFTASPSPVTPPANGSITSTITIVTDLKSVGPNSPFSFPFSSQRPLWVWSLAGLLLAMFAAWAVGGRGARRLACTLTMILLIGLVSCTGTPSTPTGTYTVKISGVAGNQSFPAKFILTVK